MKKNSMLKVVSILYIIFAVIMLIVNLLALAGIEATLNLLGDAAVQDLLTDLGYASVEAYTSILSASLIIGIVIAVIELVAGIVGIMQKSEMLCIVFGLALIVLTVGNFIFGIVSLGFAITDIISLIIGLILPVLYTLGAFQLKKEREGARQSQREADSMGSY